MPITLIFTTLVIMNALVTVAWLVGSLLSTVFGSLLNALVSKKYAAQAAAAVLAGTSEDYTVSIREEDLWAAYTASVNEMRAKFADLSTLVDQKKKQPEAQLLRQALNSQQKAVRSCANLIVNIS